ncbi:MAG: helix-turn-helix domain-containing protein [Clostridia bacterium]|nr:helix-turn-helix domain-containing protein [Clostridia bacterium]
MLFGKRLKELRKSKNMSQIDLADLIGVTQATIANYEKNQRSPSIDTIIELARLFEVSVPYLIGLSDQYRDMKIEQMNDIQCADYFTELLLNDQIAESEMFSRQYEDSYGLDKLFLKLFRLTLTKIGWLWEVGEITIGKEHQISHIIESFIEKFTIDTKINKSGKRILAMTVPGEKHTLGLKMLVKLLEVTGYKCHYIGEGLPIEDFAKTFEEINPDIILLSVTVPSNTVLNDYVEPYKNKEIYITGSGALYYKKLDVSIIEKYEHCLEVMNEGLR